MEFSGDEVRSAGHAATPATPGVAIAAQCALGGGYLVMSACHALRLTGPAAAISVAAMLTGLRFGRLHGRQDAAGPGREFENRYEHAGPPPGVAAPAASTSSGPPPPDPCAVNLAAPTIAKVVSADRHLHPRPAPR
jgi:hypothetical protein